MRTRLLAKQCVLQGIVEDRLALADRLHIHKHSPEVLTPGAIIGIWRKPDRKDIDGWRGPAELVSVERKTASAIVKHQGRPLLIPFRHLRKHALETLFTHLLQLSPTYWHEFFTNPWLAQQAHEVFISEGIRRISDDTSGCLLPLMDIADGTAMGKLVWIGLQFKDGSYEYVPNKAAIDNCRPLQLFAKAVKLVFATPHGILYGAGLGRLPRVEGGTWGLMLRWLRTSRVEYQLRMIRLTD